MGHLEHRKTLDVFHLLLYHLLKLRCLHRVVAHQICEILACPRVACSRVLPLSKRVNVISIIQAELTTNQVLHTERASVKPEASTKAHSLVPPQLRPGRIQIWLEQCDVTRIFPKTWLCWTCSWWKCNLRNTGDLPRLGRNTHGGSEPGPGFPKQWEPERRNTRSFTCPENFHLSRKL